MVDDFDFINDFKDAICLRWHRAKLVQRPRTGLDAHLVCPLTVLAPRLTQLIAEAGDSPLAMHRNYLRHLVFDLLFIDENGDSVIDEPKMEILERNVNVLIDATLFMHEVARRRQDGFAQPKNEALIKETKETTIAKVSKPTLDRKPVPAAKSHELEDLIYEMAVSGVLAKASDQVVKAQLKAGIPITYLKRNDIVREYPDGRIEVLGHVKKTPFKAPPGVEVIPSN